jgi:farnesyl diphosphate synthase
VPNFTTPLADAARLVEAHLAAIMAREAASGAPERLVQATRHAVLGGGKRFRPFLVFETAKLFGVSPEQAKAAAAAVELIHCYSLVHDDLPSMDNDELRRGQPTVWKAYGEWTAILAGDGLQALAFEVIGDATCHHSASVRAELVQILARASGLAGMVGGQALDLEADTVNGRQAHSVDEIIRLQAMKTGALIRASCEMGAALGCADAEQRAALRRYGDALGVAFQISDDLLDAEGNAARTGKATGKDAAAGKATLVSLLGLEEARSRLNATVADAIQALEPFGDNAKTLADAARFMGRREH